MNLEPHLTFTSDPTFVTAVGALLASVAGAAGAAVLVPAVVRNVLPKPRETHLADFLPFEAIEPDGRTVRLKNGEVARYYLVGGLDQSFMDFEEWKVNATHRKNFLDSLGEIHVVARIFTIRRQIEIPSTEGYPNALAAEVADKWNSQFKKAYKTLNVVCLSAKLLTQLNEAEQSLTGTLEAFEIRHLSQDPEHNDQRLTLGEFLGSLTSPVTRPAPKATGSNLSDVLAGDIVWFRSDGIVEFSAAGQSKYAAAIGLKRISDDINATMSAELNSLPIELIISRYIEPMSKGEALIKLEQHSRLATASSFNPAQVAQDFAEAQNMVDGADESRSALCAYSQTIFIFGDTIEEVEKHEAAVRAVISSNGATPVREAGATQASWFLQFPTLDLLPRPYKLFTYNLAYDFTFDKPAVGFENSGWGPGPIAHFQTLSRTIYQHQFHISDEADALGHGVVIAPTGAGKTVLMEFLSLMASRHRNLRHFFFDRYHGTAIYNLAMGGKYISLNADPLPWSEAGGMNPFDCDDTKGNRDFLKKWIEAITKSEGHEEFIEISDAVDIAFDELDREERSLASIHQATFSPGSRIRNELQRWVSPNGYGAIFNAEKDVIDIEGNWLTAFDMTKLLEDSDLGAATVHYLLHKIRNAMRVNNAPGFIFIDETEPLIRNPAFADLFRVALQEFRKIQGVVISVFQRPGAIRDAGVSQLVRQQSGTYYLFQNPGARASDYEEFELSGRELAFVLGESGLAKSSKRSVLIKRAQSKESVIVDIDLSALGPHLKIFSSSHKDVALVSELYKKLDGKWIERYIHHEAP